MDEWTGSGKGCGKGRTPAPWDWETTGRGDWAGYWMWLRGTGRRGVANKAEKRKMGASKRHATALFDRETSCHGEVNHEPTMGNLTTGSRENAL